ncbi:MAG: uridylate kinase [Planctomycetota bacterium]|jgi:uridylate kinase
MSVARTPVIVRYGGSLLVPYQLDVQALRSFMEMLEPFYADHQFYLVIGGGQTSRMYQDALHALGGVSAESVDYMGILGIQMNAEFVRIFFGDAAHSRVYNSPQEIDGVIDEPIVVCGALNPGHSSNMDAVEFARHVGSVSVLNLSNIDYVYSANPKEDPSATPLETLTWSEYLDLIPSEFTPKLATPFDPVAARMARDLDLEVVIMNGGSVEEIQKYLKGEDFKGTRIAG